MSVTFTAANPEILLKEIVYQLRCDAVLLAQVDGYVPEIDNLLALGVTRTQAALTLQWLAGQLEDAAMSSPVGINMS